MGQILNLDTAQTLLAQGKGVIMPFSTITTSITAVGATSGFLNPNVGWNVIGTTVGSTYAGIPLPPGSTPLRLVSFFMYSGSGGWLANLYHIGSIDMTATGDKFTRDAWTAPLQRTVMGQANQPMSFIPIVVMRSSNATTAPVFRMRTAAGAAGYTNQDGNAVIGTKTITAPAATTALGTTYVLRLEDGDSGVRDINAIEVTTAATAGIGDVYLMEMLAVHGAELSSPGSIHDKIVGGIEMPDIRPAVPASGTVNSYLVTTSFTNGSATMYGAIVAVEDV